MTYLQAVQRAGTLDADKVMAEWKGKPIKDFFGEGVIRPDGRYAHDMYLMQVKSPAESRAPGTTTRSSRNCPPTRCGPPRPRASASTGNELSRRQAATPVAA
jgi:hypothetical protein